MNSKNQSFFSYLLTLVITGISLILSSSLIGTIYSSSTKQKTFKTEDLIQFYGKNVFFFLQLFPFVIALLVLLFCVKFIHKQQIKELFTQKIKFSCRRLFVSFSFWGILLILLLIVQLFIFQKPIKWNYASESFWILMLISFIFVSFQTLFEEILFRGYLLQSFSSFLPKKWMAILASSFLFGLMHFANPEIKIFGNLILIYYILTGVFLSLISVLDKGIELAFGFHLANNLFGTLILTNNWQVFQTDALFKDYSKPIISWEIWITLFIFYPILFFSFKKIYKWKIGEIFA
jgi:membrane protease YdiL (CAAX protease family)